MEANKKNIGIEILRIVAMLFVVNIHTILRGGVMRAAPSALEYSVACLLWLVSQCAVDIFGLISGFVGYFEEKEFDGKFYRKGLNIFLQLWFEVVFWGVIIVGIFLVIFPNSVEKSVIIKSFFPLLTREYWYFSAYSGIILLRPLINLGISHLNAKQSRKLIVMFIGTYSFFGVIRDTFTFGKGYSFAWILTLYILGALIRKADIRVSWKKAVIGIIGLYLILAVWVLYIEPYTERILGDPKGEVITDYVSPVILGIAFLYVIMFSGVNISSGNRIARISLYAGSSTFAVYLLNDHPLVKANIVRDGFTWVCNGNIIFMVIRIFAIAFICMILAVLGDKIRIKIFRVMRINYFTERIINVLELTYKKTIKDW